MDRRDRSHDWFEDFDERTMTVAKVGHDDDDAEDRIPVVYEVCGTCEGRGKHVNPNIDRNGLTGADFDEDPDLAENYFSGMYDVPCNECGGKRVAIVIDDTRATPEQVRWVQDWYQEQHADHMTRFYENGGQW